ncbi:hypothetical protein PF005_g13907 [Phytophthora fragariae]|uniref:RxLR effector protein n=2 Tax=Phytophthora TaxID=4783 RepID=A0A6A3XQ21_9STRA|nr:hypothetical protein PF003_g40156 [Phytophthora fragariae]KAE9038290.1 hypothetical protein PR001_g8011 [Phytophthora rubi]KAE8935023.1 hypothetical protein PF009_g15015 [Phytophthora fragariae]KAE9083009.1 hypothetical protein PF007_g22076 [Phytophthora fragariae]KAE9083276.1 hypothetical protein PF010_g21272 [Phytophthora fragariae]
MRCIHVVKFSDAVSAAALLLAPLLAPVPAAAASADQLRSGSASYLAAGRAPARSSRPGSG